MITSYGPVMWVGPEDAKTEKWGWLDEEGIEYQRVKLTDETTDMLEKFDSLLEENERQIIYFDDNEHIYFAVTWR